MKIHLPFRPCKVNELSICDARGVEIARVTGDYENDAEEMAARTTWLINQLNRVDLMDDGK